MHIWHSYTAVSAAWKEAFPDLAYIWGTLRPIQKADMGRLALLYLHGGFYFDLDVINEKDTDLSEWVSEYVCMYIYIYIYDDNDFDAIIDVIT